MELGLHGIVIRGRAGRVQLFQFPDGAHVQRAGQVAQLPSHLRFSGPGCSRLVEHPAAHRHISSEAIMSRSALTASVSR